MPCIIMLIPTGRNVGLTIVRRGLIRTVEKQGVRVIVFKPVVPPNRGSGHKETRNDIVTHHTNAMNIDDVESFILCNKKDILLEKIISLYYNRLKKETEVEVILVEGVVPNDDYPFINQLNYDIARALNAEMIFVLAHENQSLNNLKRRIELICSRLEDHDNKKIMGIIINQLHTSVLSDSALLNPAPFNRHLLYEHSPLPVLGFIPWNINLASPRTIDIVCYLGATIIHGGEMNTRRIKSVTVCSQGLPKILEYLHPETLLVTDRTDVLVAASLKVLNGVQISAIILTSGDTIDPDVTTLLASVFQTTGLPMFTVSTNLWQTVLKLQRFNIEEEDQSIVEQQEDYVSSYMDYKLIQELISSYRSSSDRQHRCFSPSSFRYYLVERARESEKTILFPEGEEPRIIKAASICAQRGIAHCILLGHPDEIIRRAAMQQVTLGSGITLLDPNSIREKNKYISRLIELRKSKGMTEKIAYQNIKDNVVLGTLMLEQDHVDGVIAGTLHTTANTIRPALQLIKLSPGNTLISSIFFMLMPDQVLVYGDCAINPNPSANQLAEIAIQSADSAAAFGIEPRVAMISYSTGNSGSGKDVETVRQATKLVQEKRPDILIDGPLQYDAAIISDVALSKAPNSPVAGKATVFIFPDLNTGNTTYKAVQRSANITSIGPMLQGIYKPVNDLSRGALVDDIVYTVALTAIQAQIRQERAPCCA